MNYYHIWADLKEGSDPKIFSANLKKFLEKLVSLDKMDSYSITRMKLGFRSMDLPEFHIIMKFKTMQDLDDAMTSVIGNDNDIETEHVSFNSMIDQDTIQHALYRDYPDE